MTAKSSPNPRRNVLFYGGCHAEVLSRVFSRFGMVSDTDYDVLVNFKLIQSGVTFPYNKLHSYTDVVYSPIFNKGPFNTDMLVEQCRKLGINAVCYPWLQWNGYFPYIVKESFAGGAAWWHGRVPGMQQGGSFEQFCDDFDVALANKSAILGNFDRTTVSLFQQESSGNCDIKVSEFILDNYKDHRLFLTPDHPAKRLYDYVVSQISNKLAIPVDDSYFLSARELQTEVQVPIFPRTSEVLGLKFWDGDFHYWTGNVGQRCIHADEYRRIVYGALQGNVYYRTLEKTFIKATMELSDELEAFERFMLPAGAMVQLKRLEVVGDHLKARLNWIMVRGQWVRPSLPETVYLYLGHWQQLAAN